MTKEDKNHPYRDEIDTIISQAIAEKTFSLEALDRIKSLRDSVEDLESEVSRLRDSLSHEVKKASTLAREVGTLDSKLLEKDKQLLDIAEREKKASYLEVRAEFNGRRGDEIKELFLAMMRNPTLMKTHNTMVPTTQMGGGSYLQPVNETSTETVQ